MVTTEIPMIQTFMANMFARILYKTNFGHKKGNQSLLCIDLLKKEVKKELLEITIFNLEQTYRGVLEKKAPYQYMKTHGEVLLLNLIKRTCEDFLVKQYGSKINVNVNNLQTALYTKNILRDCEILFQVPFYSLLDPRTAIFKKIYYPIYNFASESFIEALLDNLIIEVSNCIIYFSIVTFSFLDTFRQVVYRSKFLSLRNFERFRNNLIWQVRIKNLVQTPVDLYNNCYRIYILRTSGIYSRVVYANRAEQMGALAKFPLAIISFVEIKDFLVSRTEEAIYLFSKGARFTFTSVIGKVIGLLWRGIIEGLKK